MTATECSASPRLCPSARCEPGATLLGIVGADGRVGYLTPQLIVDEAFTARVRDSTAPPETRFRFAQPCIEGGCHHWTGHALEIMYHRRAHTRYALQVGREILGDALDGL